MQTYQIYRRLPDSDIWAEIASCDTAAGAVAVVAALLTHATVNPLLLRIERYGNHQLSQEADKAPEK